ncbi:ABC transporter permease [Parafrankia discariae]|uniref:ABC transporter permease n=1 Tax=Parafrankia discariae TaxID=365528 RepID=UPI000377D524|nr:FtsX-like permease family protein [Parafrankia discariae]
MIAVWAGGLVRHRSGRLLATACGIALAVGLVAALGSFLTASKATMTARAARPGAVDWQVEVQPGADPAAVLTEVRSTGGVHAALPVTFARGTGFEATVAGSTQRTGPGRVLGLPPSYQETFPRQIRLLAGSAAGVLIAQQTAANLHISPGGSVTVALPGVAAVVVRIAGVVDLPQADSLFQDVGAPPQAQPAAPPDNVILLPRALFDASTAALRAADPATVTTQFHVARNGRLPADPAAAFNADAGAARNLEARTAGGALVGDNLGAALDAARQDALYAQVLFLFLGAPGAILAVVLAASVAAAGAPRRRREQALLRVRGLRPRQVAGLAVLEAAAVGLTGSGIGLAVAAVVGRVSFGAAAFGAGAGAAFAWSAAATLLGLASAAAAVLVPALRDLRTGTVLDARRTIGRPAGGGGLRSGRRAGLAAPRTGGPLWARLGLDAVLLTGSLLVFRASSSNHYSLVLAPEGMPRISVSYWAFLGPALLWLGSALLLWRLVTLALTHGRRPLARLVRPLTGTLASTTAAGMSRGRRPLARAVVVLALAVSFAASVATFNATYRQQAEVDAQLTNGADVTVTEPPGAGAGPEAGRRLAVAGVRHVEPLQHRFAYVGSDLQDLYGVRPSTIASVTALRDAYFSGGSADSLLATLAARPDSVLVSAETVTDFQLTPGDTLNLRVQDGQDGTPRTIPFRYAGVVREFPTAPSDSFLVANADYLARATGSDAVGAFLLDTGGRSQPAVAARLRAQLGATATVTDITQARTAVGSSLTSVDLSGLTRIELSFAVVLAAGAGGVVLALDLAERRRTFAVATVLGASRRQLRGLVLSEAAVVTIGGLAGGALIGWGVSRILVKVLTGVFDPPPDALAVPWSYLGVTALAAGVAVATAAVNGARRTSRPAVEELRDG